MKKILSMIILIVACLSWSQTAAAGFPEQTITIILPTPPGGGYDTYAKALQPYLQKHLPNKVDIVVQHMPGAGMTRAANALYNAKPDGYTIGYISIPGMVINQLLGEKGYDLKKMTWIGRNDQTPYVLAAGKNAPFTTIAEMQKSAVPIKFASESVGTTDYVLLIIIPKLMKIPFQLITGYEGSRQTIVGVMRGDAQATCFPVPSLYKFFQSGDLKPIFVLARERSPLAPNTPTTVELGYPELANFQLNRLIGGPPGIPADRVKILEEALIKAENDPELKKWSVKTANEFDPLPAKEAGNFVNTVFSSMGKYVEMVREVREKK